MNRNCADDESLSAYVDGELDGAARRLLDAHLSACRSCARRADELQQLKTLFGPLREEWAPINVVDTVRAAIKEDCSCGWGWRKLAVFPVVLLSFGSLALGAVLGTQLTERHETSTAAAVRLAPFAAVPPGNLCVGHASCTQEGKI